MANDFGLVAVMALAARVVREAIEPDAIKAALGAVVCLLQPECTEVRHVGPTGTSDTAELVRQVAELLTTAPRTELARVFAARYYSRWAALLLGPSVVSWLSLLSRAHREELFFAHFLDAPPREALEAVASALQSARHTDDDDASDGGASASARLVAATCVTVLEQMVARRRMVQLFETVASEGASAPGSAEADSLVSLLCSLPERLANRLRAPPPAALSASGGYFRVLIEQGLAAGMTRARARARLSPSPSPNRNPNPNPKPSPDPDPDPDQARARARAAPRCARCSRRCSRACAASAASAACCPCCSGAATAPHAACSGCTSGRSA